METINNYLEVMFRGQPPTPEILRIKADLLDSMEEKYHELKADGKSENEAVGIVISEFGNVDELIQELGYSGGSAAAPTADPGLSLRNVSREETVDYIALMRRGSLYVGGGVALILIGVSLMIWMSHLIEISAIFAGVPGDVDGLALLPLFFFLVPAVGLFVLFGLKQEPYKWVEKGEFHLSPILQRTLEKEFSLHSPRYTLGLVVGICLCVLSPVPLFVGGLFGETGSTAGLCLLLLIIGAAVFLIIWSSMSSDAYKQLLKTGDYSTAAVGNISTRHKTEKVISAVAAVVWPLAVAVFLYLGFVHSLWHICWVIFPIVGVLFGAFSGVYTILAKEDNR